VEELKTFSHHKIVHANQNEILYLYLDRGLEEFSNELGMKEEKTNLIEEVKNYIHSTIPSFKGRKVKILSGNIPVTTILI
jgi:hypothetical protein